MNRREFLRSTMAVGVVAALPLPGVVHPLIGVDLGANDAAMIALVGSHGGYASRVWYDVEKINAELIKLADIYKYK